MKYTLLLVFATLCLSQSCAQTAKNSRTESSVPSEEKSSSFEAVDLSEAEWKERLSPEAYYILREKGTERAFSGALLSNKKTGTYVCGGCELPLFSSDSKFKSGTGWPSFFETVGLDNVVEEADHTYGMKRVEILCGRCKGHLGHVFNDGPKPTGLRYCVNSLSLKFEEKE